MKAEHILLLVVAGAVVGAGLMKVVKKPEPAAIAAVKTEQPALPPVPAPPVASAPAPVADATATIPAAPQQPAAATESAPAEKSQPQPLARSHTRSVNVPRSAPQRVQTFAAKPSPFVVHQIPTRNPYHNKRRSHLLCHPREWSRSLWRRRPRPNLPRLR
jgi:hypothetical protein